MVDIANRKQAAELVQSLLDNRIDTDEFENVFPKSRDPALKKIYLALWSCWDDSLFQTQGSLHKDLENCRDLIDRCLLFLESPLEYEDESTKAVNKVRSAFRMLTRRDVLDGNYRYWPFRSQEQYLEAEQLYGARSKMRD